MGASDGLIYYQNGKKEGKGARIIGNYATDLVTKMTLGKPNKGEQFFGSFMMNNLVIYYKALPADQIFTIVTGNFIETVIMIVIDHSMVILVITDMIILLVYMKGLI